MVVRNLALGLIPGLAIVGVAAVALAQESGDEARMTGFVAEVIEDEIVVSFELVGAFDDNVRRRIESGLPTDFTYRFHLVHARRNWFNQRLDAERLQVVAMYNAVSREYLVNYKQNGELIESRIISEPDELEAAMTSFDGLSAFELDGLRGERRRLQVRARAELGTRTLLFFIPTTRTTDWVESSRFRIDRG